MSRIRLTCPECGAQYEVPVDVIPQGGRDVQCSNCAHTWYQNHPDDNVPDEDVLAEPPAPIEPQAAPPPPVAPPARAQPPESATPPPRPPAPPTDSPAERRARRIDPAVEDVLREERVFENKRRAAEAGSVESQPDLGLRPPDDDEQARRAREGRDRLARMRGPAETPPPQQRRSAKDFDDVDTIAAATVIASRSELLPDVEEINQSLRDDGRPRAVDQAERHEWEEKPAPKKSGFGKGFFLIVLIAAIGVAVYASAPQISDAVPAAAPLLDAFVTYVDGLRAWLDGQVTNLTSVLDDMSSEAAGDTGN